MPDAAVLRIETNPADREADNAIGGDTPIAYRIVEASGVPGGCYVEGVYPGFREGDPDRVEPSHGNRRLIVMLLQRCRELEIKAKRFPLMVDKKAPIGPHRTKHIEGLEAENKLLKDEVAKLRERVTCLDAATKGDFWHWQGDGHDFPESLVCRVVMHADDLRALLAKAT